MTDDICGGPLMGEPGYPADQAGYEAAMDDMHKDEVYVSRDKAELINRVFTKVEAGATLADAFHAVADEVTEEGVAR